MNFFKRNLEDMRGITMGGHNITNIRYAYDIVLITENEFDLQNLIDVVFVHSKHLRKEVNC